MKTRELRLRAYADGSPDPSLFELSECDLGALEPGRVRVAVRYLSMDPFPRLRISGDASIAPQIPLGEVMIGRGAGEVIESRADGFKPGDLVAGELGWRDVADVDAAELRWVDPDLGPLSWSLGVLGPSGLAAYFALLVAGEAKPGEHVLVSAAAGSVGSIAVQIARLHGASPYAVAGGGTQIEYLRDRLGLQAVADYTRHDDFDAMVAKACPAGVDLFLDLVGGRLHDAARLALRPHGRIVQVGTISSYNADSEAADIGPRRLTELILKRARITGFMVGDHAHDFGAALQTLSKWLTSGDLVYDEHVTDGLENTPAAFAALFQPGPVGKQLVKVS